MLAIRCATRNQPPSGPPADARTTVGAPFDATRPESTFPQDVNDEAFDILRPPGSPVTWLFAGESFLPSGSQARQHAGIVELFTAGLRDRRHSPFDPVVDACTPESLTGDVLPSLGKRILDRNPSVVFLLCGAADSEAGMPALPGFENALLRIARQLERKGILLVLNTSPVPYCTDDDPSAATHMIYAEAVRALATELELPLIDHRRDWEQLAVPPGESGSWFNDDGRYPNALGCRRMALKLLSVLAEPGAPNTPEFMPLAATSE
jgi:hypothetical protein